MCYYSTLACGSLVAVKSTSSATPTTAPLLPALATAQQYKYMICWQIQYKWIQWIPVPLQLHLWLKPQPACNTKSTQCANKKIFLAALFAGTTFLASNIGSDTWKPNFLANSKSSQKDKSLTLLHIYVHLADIEQSHKWSLVSGDYTTRVMW